MNPAILRNLSRLAVISLLVAAGGTLIAALGWGVYQGASFAVGAALMVANTAGLAWMWWRLIAQKRIALTIGIIVIKYAVLLSSIFYLSRAHWFQMTPAGLGVASFVIAALIWATTISERENT